MAGESDREQIVDLMARFAQATDDGTPEEYAACLAEDISMTLMSGKTTKGRDAVVTESMGRRAGGKVGPGSHTRHIVSTISVKVSGDVAVVRAYLLVIVDEGGDNVVPKKLFAYRDRYRRTPDGWRLAERVVQPA